MFSVTSLILPGRVEGSQERVGLLSSHLGVAALPIKCLFVCGGLLVKREAECRVKRRRAESRACYVLARSLCFHCHRLSSTSSSPSSDVFLSARYDDSPSVDFSHCRPLFPGLFALPLFVSLAGGLTESCSLTFPSYGPCYRCLNPHKRLLSWA